MMLLRNEKVEKRSNKRLESSRLLLFIDPSLELSTTWSACSIYMLLFIVFLCCSFAFRRCFTSLQETRTKESEDKENSKPVEEVVKKEVSPSINVSAECKLRPTSKLFQGFSIFTQDSDRVYLLDFMCFGCCSTLYFSRTEALNILWP